MTQFPSEKPELFKGRHFNHLLIIQAVRWYGAYKLSYRDVCDLMAERGLTIVHTSVLLKAEGVLLSQTLVRASKRLNNMIEQDRRKGPQRRYPTLGFKIFGNEEVTLSGIELANKIKKG